MAAELALYWSWTGTGIGKQSEMSFLGIIYVLGYHVTVNQKFLLPVRFDSKFE
jgi:hypothetical protein